jgi:FlaA1/EpsC-like NDP-sugar epimerase
VAFVKIALIALIYNFWWGHLSLKFALMTNICDFFATMVVLVAFRIIILNIYSLFMLSNYKRQKNILVYGTGDDSAAVANSKQSSSFTVDYVIKGFITLNGKRKRFRIADLSVYQINDKEDLIKIVNSYDIDGILFPNLKNVQREKDRLIKFCNDINLRILTVPQMEEIKNGIVQHSVRRVKIEDLLGRDEIKINLEEISKILEGVTVMVTGAAGSIGSEICRQLAHFNIQQLVLFDSGETPMHNLRLELEENFPQLSFVPIMGNIRDLQRVEYAFRAYRPQVVFHAAAYKHVPLMEENPCEAILANVMGTRTVADAAVKYNVKRFVMISTDKAVNPSNIMGCTKRLAEIYVQSLSIALKNGKVKGITKFITTRFGNVLGSNGSVIPRFHEQIKNGGPVTVTHPDIIRYFMTIPEACRLVLEAGTIGNGGEIFIFDMGEPVKIADLARKMILLNGLVPDKDIKIIYTGLRPGEKLYEELLSNKENTKETHHEKIRIASVREYDYDEVVPHIDKLVNFAKDEDVADMVMEMKAFVPEFKSKNSQFQRYDK